MTYNFAMDYWDSCRKDPRIAKSRELACREIVVSNAKIWFRALRIKYGLSVSGHEEKVLLDALNKVMEKTEESAMLDSVSKDISDSFK